MGCPVFPRLHGALCRGEHAKSTGGRSAKGSVEIPREGIKRDQKYGDQYHGGIPHAVRLFVFFQQVSDRRTEEKNLQARATAPTDYPQPNPSNTPNSTNPPAT